MNKGRLLFNTTMFLTGMATGYVLCNKFHVVDKIKNRIGLTSPSEEILKLVDEELSNASNNANDGRTVSTFRTDFDKERLSQLLSSQKYRTENTTPDDNVVTSKLEDSNYIVIEENSPHITDSENSPDENFENVTDE